MRIAIRADASISIGTGHVMRQIALAQHLVSKDHEVCFFASITGPEWLREYLASQTKMVWSVVEEGDFSPSRFLAGGSFDALIIDSYSLSQRALTLLEQKLSTVVVVIDGPWQDLRGRVAIAPILAPDPPWKKEYSERFEAFYCGPGFLLPRQEVIELQKKRLQLEKNPKPRIVVGLGGSDPLGETERIVESLAQAVPEAEIHAYFPGSLPSEGEEFRAGGNVAFRQSGTKFIDDMARADLVVVGAGTTAVEVLSMGIPAIFIVVAKNQMENYRSLTSMGFSVLFPSGEQKFAVEIGLEARRLLDESTGPLATRVPTGPLVIDGLGPGRVVDLLLRAGQHPLPNL